MPDTQFPSYTVFDQPAEGKPTFYAGSVHAPDPEMALLNARDVFGRREDHVCLWVVRATQIYAKTAEELAQHSNSANQQTTPPTNERTPELPNEQTTEPSNYLVFQKTTHKGTLLHVGEVQATHPEEAMLNALATYPNPRAIVWWVFPTQAIHRTDPAENASLFAPAADKPFRHSNFYPTVTLLREISLANEKLNWEDD